MRFFPGYLLLSQGRKKNESFFFLISFFLLLFSLSPLLSNKPLTSTSNCAGLDASCMLVLSTIISSALMEGYFAATFRNSDRKRPSLIFMMFALWTAVTWSSLLFFAFKRRERRSE